MYPHHKETAKKIADLLSQKEDVLAVLLSGSVAHGFAKENSDVDLMIILSDEDYKAYVKRGEMNYWNTDICDYTDGYIDGKYISIDFMKDVAIRGSEPARFAFEGCQVIYSKIDGIEELVEQIVRYPVEQKEAKLQSFYSQFDAWKWYSDEAFKHENDYLLTVACSKLVLFGTRLILAENEVLFPYHKWMLRVLGSVDNKPEGMIEAIDDVLQHRDKASIDKFFDLIVAFKEWKSEGSEWTNLFMKDTELTWQEGWTPIELC